jgi:hypothetical protein
METKQTYRTQLDFLKARTLKHAKPTDGKTDLVYLEAFLEPASAVEDEELYEKALGGPDTSTRERITGRVRLHRLTEDAESCSVAWQELLGKVKGKFTNENELRPDVKLKVTFGPGGDPDDLCKPHAKAGYLGAENQAIRVQFVDKDHLTWGFDNASSLHRVEIDTNRKKVTLQTEPKDEAHWPLVDQIVEILPWSAELPNKEKVAAMRGHLTSVAKSYNAKDQTLELADAIPNSVSPSGWPVPEQPAWPIQGSTSSCVSGTGGRSKLGRQDPFHRGHTPCPGQDRAEGHREWPKSLAGRLLDHCCTTRDS